MGLKDAETAIVAEWAVKGWTLYVLERTAHLDPGEPVDLRLETAGAASLPGWLADGVRARLVALRGEALVARVVARSKIMIGNDPTG